MVLVLGLISPQGNLTGLVQPPNYVHLAQTNLLPKLLGLSSDLQTPPLSEQAQEHCLLFAVWGGGTY